MDIISEATNGLEIKESVVNNIENRSLTDEKHVIHQKQEAAMDPILVTPEKLKTPMNFSTVTVEQLGITPESFVKQSPGKSLLKKSRRRSTVGVRGSSETNLLIRYIAQQRNFEKANESPLAEASPSIQQASPFRHRNGDSVRQRISAFQSAFQPVKENEGKPGHSGPEEEFQATDCTKNKNPKRCDQPKHCGDLASKRRRISYQRDLKENIADGEKKLTDIQICHIATLPDTNRTHTCETWTPDHSKESLDPFFVAQSECLILEDIPRKDLSGAIKGKNIVGCTEEERASNAASRHCRKRGKFEKELSPETFGEIMPPIAPVYKGDLSSCESSFLRSVLKKTPVKLLLESLQEHCDTSSYDANQSFSFSDLSKGCEELKNDKSSFKVQKSWHKKRVTFGEELSPEVFDESLPANTPLRKGGTPARQQGVRNSNLPFFPKLTISEAISQPIFEEPEQDLVSMEPLEVSFAVLRPASNSSSSETIEDTDAVNSSNNYEKTSPSKVDRITRSSSRRKQLAGVTEEDGFSNLVSIDVKNKEKRPHRKKAQAAKSTSRSTSKKMPVLKNYRRKKRRGKSLKKSFYGLREVASRKPPLSPIPEIPECPSPESPTPQRSPALWCTAEGPDMHKDDYNSSKEDAMSSDLKKPLERSRKSFLSKNPETLTLSQLYEETTSSEHSTSDIESESSFGPVSFDQSSSSVSTVSFYGSGHIQHKNQLLEQDHVKKKTKSQNVFLSPTLTLTTKEEITPMVPNSSFFVWPPEALLPDVGSVCESESFDNTQEEDEGLSTGCEEQKDASVVTSSEGLEMSHLAAASEREENSLEDADMREDVDQTQSDNQELKGRKPQASSDLLSYKNLLKRLRRSSIYCPNDEKIDFEESGNELPTSSPMEEDLPLDKSELFNNLAESIKEAFKRLSAGGVKVRRSTRFQRNTENQGLIWVSLPGPSTSFTSHQAKRRTICSSNSGELENLPYTQGSSCILSSVSGRENSENDSVSGASRRKSFCTSALSENRNASRPKYYRRTSVSHRNEENHPNDLEKMEVLENPNNI
uniref:Cell division cycle associated 2 n=1 Tax=Monodelphis domestica TaxID=13616 RepID=F7D1W5_MONDO